MSPSAVPPRSSLVITAFAAVYVIWGSTYLAIRFAIETMPPFLMSGARFLIAGLILLAVSARLGAKMPKRIEWRESAIIGGLLLLGGNGAVVWAEKRIASGLAALLVATVPLWMLLFEWARRGGVKPTRASLLGVALGIAGIIVLVGPGQIAGAKAIDPIGAGAVLFAALSWSAGSIYSRGATLPESPFMAAAAQMLAGGFLLTILGLTLGETATIDVAQMSTRSVTAFLYLIVFGSIIGLTAYAWLLRVSTSAKVSTYAFVNPVVAVILGVVLAGELVTGRILAAGALIVIAVALIIFVRAGRRPKREVRATADA